MRPGTKCIGSQPSQSSAVSFTVASEPEPSQIGRSLFMCMIDMSGLPIPKAPSPVNGSWYSRPS